MILITAVLLAGLAAASPLAAQDAAEIVEPRRRPRRTRQPERRPHPDHHRPRAATSA